MKIKKEQFTVYLEDYDVTVNKYLTYADIQQIVNSTLKLAQTETKEGIIADNWASRNQNIDMVMLVCATDIPVEVLEKTSHAELLKSGLIDAVKKSIENYNQIEEAFKYTESWDKILIYFLQHIAEKIQSGDLPKKMKQFLENGTDK